MVEQSNPPMVSMDKNKMNEPQFYLKQTLVEYMKISLIY